MSFLYHHCSDGDDVINNILWTMMSFFILNPKQQCISSQFQTRLLSFHLKSYTLEGFDRSPSVPQPDLTTTAPLRQGFY
jgi:hypothetical protein